MMHANTRSCAYSCITHEQDPYDARSPASLSAIAKDSSNFLFVTATKPASLQTPAVIYYTNRCLDNNSPFPLSLTLSALLFPFPLTNAVATNVCQRTNKPNHHTSLLSPYRSTSPLTTIFLLPPLSFTYNSSTFADITQSAINIPRPTPPQNFQNLFK